MKTSIEIREDLPLKYYLNLHLNRYTEDSVLFEIINYIVANNIENKDKIISYENLKFSSKTLKYIFGEDMIDEKFKNEIIFSIKKLISDAKINVNKKYFHVTEKGILNFYNIKGKYK